MTVMLAYDARPIEDELEDHAKRVAATIGSHNLLAAMLRMVGHPAPAFPELPPPPKKVARFRERIETLAPPPSKYSNREHRLRRHGERVSQIQSIVADYYSIHPDYMVAESRLRAVARPRQIAMFLASEITGRSLPFLGKMFGNRDHSTISHGIGIVRKLMASDPKIAADVEALRERLAG